MENKSQDEFQKDVLKILKQAGEKQDKLIERVEKLEEGKVETLPGKKENLIWVGKIESLTDPNISQLSPEQMAQTLQKITEEVGPILQRHKISKLEMYLTKTYD